MRRVRPRQDMSYGPGEAEVQQEGCVISRVDHKASGRVTVYAEVTGVVKLPNGMTIDFDKHIEIPLGVYDRRRRQAAADEETA